MSIADAVAAWNTHLQPAKALKENMYLGSPAVTNNPLPGAGLSYLTDFIAACTNCSIDFVAIHWYDRATNAAYFRAHIEAVRKVAGGRPIWITEFHASGSDDEVTKFLDEVVPWLDASADVHRYAWFMAREGSLLDERGRDLSEIGRHFVEGGAKMKEARRQG